MFAEKIKEEEEDNQEGVQKEVLEEEDLEEGQEEVIQDLEEEDNHQEEHRGRGTITRARV